MMTKSSIKVRFKDIVDLAVRYNIRHDWKQFSQNQEKIAFLKDLEDPNAKDVVGTKNTFILSSN